MIHFNVSVQIDRPQEQVFAYVADESNLARWNSAVQSVHHTSPGPARVGATYNMVRQLPQGQVENTYKITAFQPDEALAIETTSGPTPFRYDYRFEPVANGTKLSLSAEVKTSGLAGLVTPLLSHGIRRGVEANLATLKQILET
ncbi:MAG: SRPBCC family protein [Chloroflexota bacterium]